MYTLEFEKKNMHITNFTYFKNILQAIFFFFKIMGLNQDIVPLGML